MSHPAISKKRHSSSMNTSTAASHSPEHSRKRVKTTDDSKPLPSITSKTLHPQKSSRHSLNGRIANGVKDVSATKVDESRAAVVAPTTGAGEAGSKKVIEISSDEASSVALSDDVDDGEEDEQDDEGEDEQHRQEALAAAGAIKHSSRLQAPHNSDSILTNGIDNSHSSPDDADDPPVSRDDGGEDQTMDAPEDNDAAEPTFGELLRTHDTEEVDVDAAFDGPDSPSQSQSMLVAHSTDSKNLAIPFGTSLTTVLTQALRTNDNELLESCFRMNDGDSIRTTIDRLPSNLVSQLLQRIAERLYKRPGRAGNLMIWVQWSIVAHGGYLASQPALVKQLASLNRVLRERAASLQPLLALKGKLDMLNAQLELRRSKQAAAREDESEADEEEPVIYVEGDDDELSEVEEKADKKSQEQNSASEKRQDADMDIGSSSDGDVGMVNGMTIEDEEDEDSESDSSLDEAEETDADSGDDLENADLEEDNDESASSGSDEAASPRREI
ncbi:MAG: Small subunit (SSU) processome component [Bathelium mastoideum]|nr:MAG: Small subunit (SSU) processome component [Bathelium mastoideum]